MSLSSLLLKLSLFCLVMAAPLSAAAPQGEPLSEQSTGRVLIRVENRMGQPFELSSLKITIDGVVVGRLKGGKEHLPVIYIENLPEGEHELVSTAHFSATAYTLLPGSREGRYGAEGKKRFEVRRNEVLLVEVVCNDRGGFLADLKARPFISYELSLYEERTVSALKIRKIDWNELKAKGGF